MAEVAESNPEEGALWPQISISPGFANWLITNRVSIAVEDQRIGDGLAYEIDGAHALAAFRHPYAYAAISTTRS